MVVRAVLDTNILVSGTLYLGKPKKVIDLALAGKVEIVGSAQTINEFKKVITRDKFRLSAAEQEYILNFVIRLSRLVSTRGNFKVIKADPDDDKFLIAEYDGKADFIVSGDHHLLDLIEFLGIRIVTEHQFLEIIGA